MKKYNLLFASCCLFLSITIHAQSVGVGTTEPDASAALDIKSTTKGLLIPAMTLEQRNVISNPATGLLVFQNDSLPGFYYNSGSPVSPTWTALGTAGGGGWQLGGNSGTNPATNFIGTTDDAPLRLKVNKVNAGYIDSTSYLTSIGFRALDAVTTGEYNTAVGHSALRANTTGSNNVANGSYALYANITGSNNAANGIAALYFNTTGSNNTANGSHALFTNTTGFNNTANGTQSLYNNTTGQLNTGIGMHALFNNTTGSNNSATGAFALLGNTTGLNNTANGNYALSLNTVGNYNSAFGNSALRSNTRGMDNTANGFNTLRFNLTGFENTANGSHAMYSNIDGYSNNACGVVALYSNNSGNRNTANGSAALYLNTFGNGNTANGFNTLRNNTSGSFNTAVGSEAGNNLGTTPSNFTAIGFNAGHVGSNSNTVEIGNSSVTWIGGNVGWSTYSDARIKNNISSNVPGLAFILKLRPVTYNLNVHRRNELSKIKNTIEWAGKYDIEKIKKTGFIAQEVEKAAKDINYDFSGVVAPKSETDLYSLRYDEFVVPLVKAVQELSEQTKEQKKIIEQQQNKIVTQQQQYEILLKRVEALEKKN